MREQNGREREQNRRERKQNRREREQNRREREQNRREREQNRRESGESKQKDVQRLRKRKRSPPHSRDAHTFLSKPLYIQKDKRYATKGSITSPKLLKPWRNFPMLQQRLFQNVYECIPRDVKQFSSVQFLKELGPKLCDWTYERFAVEGPITEIISRLRQIEEACLDFNIGDDIIFQNCTDALSDGNEEVQERLANLQSLNPNPHADQACVYKKCVYKNRDGAQSLFMVVECKPSHKLSVLNLRAGLLRAINRSMNPLEDVFNQITIPADRAKKFAYKSEWLVAAALAQTYTYIVETGIEYCYLVVEDAFVFLRIKENKPHPLLSLHRT
jgi:hypothetical protein